METGVETPCEDISAELWKYRREQLIARILELLEKFWVVENLS